MGSTNKLEVKNRSVDGGLAYGTISKCDYCSKDDAIAKMLGLLRGPLDPESLPDWEFRAYDELVWVYTLGAPLEQRLQELLSGATKVFLNTYNWYYEPIMNGTIRYYEFIKLLVSRANLYSDEIEIELSKGKKSALIINKEGANESNQVYISVSSLDAWSRKKFKIPIIRNSKELLREIQLPVSFNFNADYTKNEEIEDDDALSDDKLLHDIGKQSGMSGVVADRFQTTFAFLVDAFSRTSEKYGGKKGKPNVSAIAEHVSQLASHASGKDEMKFQSAEAIKGRIEESSRVRDRMLSIFGLR